MVVAVRRGSARSPLVWIGGKYYSVAQVLAALPPAQDYDVYCEPMGGAAHVLAGKLEGSHREIYNDANQDLVNFWMWVRDRPAILEERLRSLPYSRVLYYRYHASLYDGTELDSLERAVRWFYVLRSSFSFCVGPVANGWSSSGLRQSKARSYQNALSLFEAVSERFRYVQLDCRDVAAVIEQYQGLRTLFYVDPPYIDCEHYYRDETGAARFTWADHERLAVLLNQTQAKVALSYYPHPQLEEWYPADRWRRCSWEMVKHAQLTRAQRDKGQEVLLMNYPESVGLRAVPLDLWGEP
jgi:DNA adenine methylase